jgi:hypothetical protein
MQIPGYCWDAEILSRTSRFVRSRFWVVLVLVLLARAFRARTFAVFWDFEAILFLSSHESGSRPVTKGLYHFEPLLSRKTSEKVSLLLR